MDAKHKRHSAVALLVAAVATFGTLYGMTAYEFVPSAWRFVESRHPALQEAGTRSYTSAGIPGDPFNIAFVGTEVAVRQALAAAHWFDADPITLRSSVRIVVDSAAHRTYTTAPVSNLYLYGRRQDLAFESPSGADPARRHHVRFWEMNTLDLLNRPLWIGAATYDSGVGVSHTTGQITHHIAANIDRERDGLIRDLLTVPGISVEWIDHYQPQLTGRNGGGDHYYTDGRLAVIEVTGTTQGPAPAR